MPTPSRDDILSAYDRTVAQVRRAVLDYVTAVWRTSGSYRGGDVDRLVAAIVPRVQAGQIQVANLTSAYIAAVRSVVTGETVVPVLVERAAVLDGRGVAATMVYTRPLVTVWTELAKGAMFDAAVSAGLDRLTSLASTDMQMAKVRQAQASFQSGGVRYYRRTLVGPTNCALCALASTQRYHSGDLLPIHPGCNCGVDELPDDVDPGQVLDEDTKNAVHEAVADKLGISDPGGRAIDYRKLVLVQQHGEYGPTLTLAGHHFTGPEAIKAGTTWDDLAALGLPRL